MKVAMVNTALNKGGAARMARTLALAEKALGIDVTLYHAQDATVEAPYYGLQRPLSRPLNVLLGRLGGANWTMDCGLAAELVERTRDADVLHVHNLHGYYLDYRRLLLAWADRPVVWTWHDMWGATGRCGFAFECEGWKAGCKSCPHTEYYPAAWLDRARYEYRAKENVFGQIRRLWIVTPSDWLRDIAVERGFRAERVKIVPNPVDLDKFQALDKQSARQKLGLVADGVYLLFVAADCSDPRKGYEDFAEIVASGKSWQGLVVGAPPQKRHAGIVYAGQVHEAESLSLYYSAADLFVIPSYADNYPNTVVEALACGTAVAGYSTGGIPSQVQYPAEWLVPTGDTDGLYRTVRARLGAATAAPGSMGSLRGYARRRWAPQVVAREYAELYRRTQYA